MKKIKLFDHNDFDAVGVSVLAQLAFGQENVDIDYCNYNNINEKVQNFIINKEYKQYNKIFITDISVNECTAMLLDKVINEQNLDVMLLDHHATELKRLQKYSWANVRVNFNSNNYTSSANNLGKKASGTQLFYSYLISKGFFDSIKYWDLYNFVEIIRQYDTWEYKDVYHWDIPKKWNDLLYILGKEEFITKCLVIFDGGQQFILNFTDKLILKLKQQEIDNYIQNKEKQMKQYDIKGHTVGIIFAEQYQSEMGNKLSIRHPELDLIAMIDIGNKTISYRTIKDNINVGNFAKIFGGGGHSKTSGSEINNQIIDNTIKAIFKLESED